MKLPSADFGDTANAVLAIAGLIVLLLPMVVLP
jgi:hypothetical protein